MVMNNATYSWGGSSVFRLNGSGLHEDTLRIKSDRRKHEQKLKLIFPTLCITYADMKFQNNIGGEQENYPISQAYGPAYFDPPIKIIGEEKIEKFTYIRGAYRVEIGPKETIIEFSSWNELVIPRLRIAPKKPIEASLHIPETDIQVEEPLRVTILQYADGRHIGGVRIEKRHPKWQPSVDKNIYDLWLRVIDGISLQPFPKVRVDIWHWDPKAPTPYGTGSFRLDGRIYTNKEGTIHISERPSGELEAFSASLPGRRAVVRCLRPLDGQKVRFHMRVWPLIKDTIQYKWQDRDTLEDMAQFTGYSAEEILKLNQVRSESELKPGLEIVLPCYMATYRMEQWDTFDWVAKTFGYGDAKGLAEVNGLKDEKSFTGGEDIILPDWHFFYAREKDILEEIDVKFNLPKGSTITVGRAYHPDSRLPYVGETIAVPTLRFTDKLKKLTKADLIFNKREPYT